jgi:hypothetical protein
MKLHSSRAAADRLKTSCFCILMFVLRKIYHQMQHRRGLVHLSYCNYDIARQVTFTFNAAYCSKTYTVHRF